MLTTEPSGPPDESDLTEEDTQGLEEGGGAADGDDDEDEHEYPAIDEASLTIDMGEVGESGLGAEEPTPGGRSTGGGSQGLPPLERVTRAIGARGEEAVYLAERKRLVAEGQSPDLVRWISRDRPLSPYDIETVLEGQRVYIEVKATKGSDPFAPFEISAGEIVFGLQKRGNYMIDRVTEAHTSAPTITRFEDPLGLLSSGSALLKLSSARLAFREAE